MTRNRNIIFLAILSVFCIYTLVPKDSLKWKTYFVTKNAVDTENNENDDQTRIEDDEVLMGEEVIATKIQEELAELPEYPYIPFESYRANSSNDTERCEHPKNINPFDPEIMKFYKRTDVEEECEAYLTNLTELIDGVLVNNNPTLFDCWGRCHVTTNRQNKNKGNFISTNETHLFPCDIVEVACSSKGEQIKDSVYEMIHTQIFKRKLKASKRKPSGKQYNVFVLGIDSLTYTQTFRNIPLIRNFLLRELNAVEFPFVNIVGHNSRNNFVAWFYGKLGETVGRYSQQKEDLVPPSGWACEREHVNCQRPNENDTSLMKEFEDYGYVTAQVEDWFPSKNFECEGFVNKAPIHNNIPLVMLYENNDDLRKSLEFMHCLQRHQLALDYFGKFIRSDYEKPKFGYARLTTLGEGSVWETKKLEKDLLYFLKQNKKWLDNSFFFIKGDLGQFYTSAQATRVGRYDMKNPMLMVSIPKELRNGEIMKLLNRNSIELQTHFDTRATLLDILKFQPKSNFTSTSMMNVSSEPFGHSYLREQPKSRNCETLPIRQEFCLCDVQLKTNLLNADSDKAEKIGWTMAATLNSLLAKDNLTEICAPWKLENVTSLLTHSKGNTRLFEGVIKVRNSETEKRAKFQVVLSEKDDVLELKSYKRIGLPHDSGNCGPKVTSDVCDCRRSKKN